MGPTTAKAQHGPAQKHLHSRISYLYQAATYLAGASGKGQSKLPSSEAQNRTEEKFETGSATSKMQVVAGTALKASQEEPLSVGMADSCGFIDAALTHQLLGHLRAVSLKGQIRLSPVIKHSICKRCDLLLVPGRSATIHTENKSRCGKKAWADVLVTTCSACATAKRFPVGAKRQLRRQDRPARATLKPGNI